MTTTEIYKKAIKRVFAQQHHDEDMAVYWGRDDKMIHVIASMKHYVHLIGSNDDDTLEFVSSNRDRVVVTLNDDERRQLERAI
jgi:hypothetical protein